MTMTMRRWCASPLLLLLGLIVIGTRTVAARRVAFLPKSSRVVAVHRKIATTNFAAEPEHHRSALSISAALDLRGGSTDPIDLNDNDDDSGLIVVKLRNMFRSILSITDRKSPTLSKLIKSLFARPLESIMGVRLLPQKKKSKKKKAKNVTSEKTKVSDAKSEETSDSSKSDMKEAKEKKSTKKSTKKTKPKISKAAEKHISQKINSRNPNYRIQKELKDFLNNPPPNLTVKVGSDMRVWIVTMIGANNTIYQDEVYKLRISFPKDYPMVPPSVYFLPGNIPTHEHVYTNGDICLSLLGEGWKPNMTAQSIAVSILSILSSAKYKKLPMDNAKHALNKPGKYQKDWVYHDDVC